MYDTAAIKARINCVAAAQRCGLPVSRSGDRIVSPLRAGAKNKTSFCVDEDFWYDFGSARGGDVIDLWAELKCNGDRGAAIRELAQLVGVRSTRGQDPAAWEQYTQNLCNQIAFWQSQLTEDDRAYLHSRGLSDDTITALKFGRTEDGRLSIPYLKNGYVAYYCTRHLPGGSYPESKYRKQKKDGLCEHIVWGLDTLNRPGDTLIIAEGAFDAISFWEAGYPVLSAVTGHFSKDQLPTLLSAARKFSRTLIVYDNDPTTHAGERFTERTARLLLQAKIPFVVGAVPTPYHDVSDYYAAGNSLEPIVSTAQDGVSYLIRTFTEFSDLERFCLNVSRHIKRTTLEDLFATITKSERFNDRAVKALYRVGDTATTENIVTDEIMDTHQLVYINSVGFYEYAAGVWSKQPDGTIKSYADSAYGTFSTAQRVNAVCNLLKVRSMRSVAFDRQPVWNFINGTLELDTGTFRDHNPNDFCSIQSSFPYDPEAGCPAWEQFVDDITAGDPRAAEILQFIPGYALFHDCPHEKVFVLTGSGGNGKSRYLQALGQLFGEDNCSYLQPRALLDKFQVIQLKDSIINLAGEIKSDLRDVEEAIKKVATGEPISGCYKGEQFVTYRPRTKLVFACNGQLASGDTSEGLTRRLIMVDFKVRFVDQPDPADPYQRLKNINIFDSISREIATGGVFNWVYAGYRLLKQVGYFTTTDDQDQLLQDFKRASNPVLLFYEEINPSDPELTNKQLYEDYKQWCVENGYRALNANWFHREFKQVAKHDYEPFLSNGVRGYRKVVVTGSV